MRCSLRQCCVICAWCVDRGRQTRGLGLLPAPLQLRALRPRHALPPAWGRHAGGAHGGLIIRRAHSLYIAASILWGGLIVQRAQAVCVRHACSLAPIFFSFGKTSQSSTHQSDAPLPRHPPTLPTRAIGWRNRSCSWTWSRAWPTAGPTSPSSSRGRARRPGGPANAPRPWSWPSARPPSASLASSAARPCSWWRTRSWRWPSCGPRTRRARSWSASWRRPPGHPSSASSRCGRATPFPFPDRPFLPRGCAEPLRGFRVPRVMNFYFFFFFFVGASY